MKPVSDSPSLILTRRAALLAASAASVSACNSWPKMPAFPDSAGYACVVDAHCHMFTASDLPVEGFLKYIVIPQLNLRTGLFDGFIDAVAGWLQRFSMTARRELELHSSLATDDLRTTKEEFAKFAAEESVRKQGGSLQTNTWETGFMPEAAATDIFMLQIWSESQSRGLKINGVQVTPQDMGIGSQARLIPDASPRQAAALRQSALEVIVAQVEAGYSTEPDSTALPAQPERSPLDAQIVEASLLLELGLDQSALADFDLSVERVGTLVAWVFDILQPRTQHLRRYLKLYRGDTAQPRTLMNFLVDYDLWLRNRPDDDSDMLDQIELWHVAKREYQRDLTLHTFAGYCPLKDIVEARQRSLGQLVGSTTSERVQAAILEQKATGLKLYPPMGFRPIGNTGMPDEAFIGRGGIETLAYDAWRSVARSGEKLGDELDAALTRTYAWCETEGVPIVAHAGPGNNAGAGFDERPNPSYWLQVARNHPKLKLSLGHLIEDASEFVLHMEKGSHDQTRKIDWVFTSMRDLLLFAVQNQREIYIDIGYTNEILGGKKWPPDLAKRFLTQLREYFLPIDERCEHLVFGTDWIMLGQEPNYQDYLNRLTENASAAGWLPFQMDNFFRLNAFRFLGMPDRCPATPSRGKV